MKAPENVFAEIMTQTQIRLICMCSPRIFARSRQDDCVPCGLFIYDPYATLLRCDLQDINTWQQDLTCLRYLCATHKHVEGVWHVYIRMRMFASPNKKLAIRRHATCLIASGGH